jgi:RNA polymerase-binding protein DksA
MPIDQKTLEELKQSLLKEKEELESNLSRIAKPINKASGDYEASFEKLGEDQDENAIEVEEYSDNLPVEEALEKKLQDVIAALLEIENETYGICKNCNQEISVERLQANPSARTCIKCK